MFSSRLLSSFALPFLIATMAFGQQKSSNSLETDSAVARALRHATTEWQMIAPHLPDPVTASPTLLQQAGDVLRVRRFLEDALEYYGYALKRGGDEAALENRIGVTELQLGQPMIARTYFRRSVQLSKKNAEGWNNLGAVETINGNVRQAISYYKRAVKINHKNALFHANLGSGYFAVGDYDSARREFEVAVEIDPEVFERGGFSGSMVHVLSPADRALFAFEMARLAASHGQEESTLHWLAQASEAGLDLRFAMQGIREFAPYLKDARVAIIMQNTRSLRSKEIAATDPIPTLAPASSIPQ